MSFTTKYLKSCSTIGTKIISELKSFGLQNTAMQKYSEDACDGAYSVNSLNDSELLDLGSASLSITRYLRIDENNTLRIFMLSGSIQFSIPIQFNTNHAFVKIMLLYNACVM